MNRIQHILIAGALCFMLPYPVFAANLSVFPQSISLHTGDEVEFLIRVQSATAINAIESNIVLPPQLTFLSASEGNVISQWIEEPAYNKTQGNVSFAGIMSNGWQGEGTLVSIKVAALSPGTYSLNFDKASTAVYLNDGKATPAPITFGSTSSIKDVALYIGLALVGLGVILFLLRRKYRIKFV